MNSFGKHPYLNHVMYNYEKLIAAIEKLETDGIISFDDFEKLAYHEIHKQYFSMPNPTMIEKAKIKIRDKRSGEKGPSEYITMEIIYKEGKPEKKIIRKHQF